MRSYLPRYQLKTSRELGEVLQIMAREPEEWKPFAGGTDLMVLLEQGRLEHQKFLNLWGLAELRGIEVADTHVTLGAMTTYHEVQTNPVLQLEFPLLCRAASETGGVATQNRGTLGGNIANASPAADSPPALLVYDAELELVSAGKSRWIRYQDFHLGYKKMAIEPQELIRQIRLRRDKKPWHQCYRKVGTRRAQAISKVCFAGAVLMEEDRIVDARIAFGSVAPTPLRCSSTEALLRGRVSSRNMRDAIAELAREIQPIDDFRSTARYRTKVAQNLLQEFLATLESTPAP